MSLYDRVAAIRGGGRALAGARLRRAVLKALHRAFLASSMGSQAELAKRLKVRRSAVNQVFRGDGNVRINTLAEYLYEMGYEIDITLVKSGERGDAMSEKPDTESSAPPPPPQPVEGTPVEVPHINFDEPTGNALAEVRKGYGLTPLETRKPGADMDESTLSQLHAKLSEASHALHEAWEIAHAADDNAFNTYGDLADIVATHQARVYNELYGDNR